MTPVTLYRSGGPKAPELLRQSGWTRFPPRLPEQPYFSSRRLCPPGRARLERQGERRGLHDSFHVDAEYLSQFDAQWAGGPAHPEYWIPADRLEEFNRHIVGAIQVIAGFARGHSSGMPPDASRSIVGVVASQRRATMVVIPVLGASVVASGRTSMMGTESVEVGRPSSRTPVPLEVEARAEHESGVTHKRARKRFCEREPQAGVREPFFRGEPRPLAALGEGCSKVVAEHQ